jgi:hypothetical protein
MNTREFRSLRLRIAKVTHQYININRNVKKKYGESVKSLT